jgi:A/G-specific adenine glycosylase
LPVKEKTLLRKHRWFYYFLFEHEGKILVNFRSGNDIWQNLYEFYLLETEEQVNGMNAHGTGMAQRTDRYQKSLRGKQISPVAVQQLTHQQIKGQFIRVELSSSRIFQELPMAEGWGIAEIAVSEIYNELP